MRLVVILLIIGFPTLIIFSWIYDVTPEGVVKTETNRSSSKTNYSIFILLVVVGGGLLFFFQDRFFKPAVNPKSVAVLPFDNYSPNPDDKYLSAGFTEVIIANLAKVQDLFVISRTSVMRYKDTEMNLKEIAEELNVANILEGSIQRTENEIRVVSQLIEAETDKHLWAETYDADFEDIFSIQTSIAKEIASALKSKITESEKSVIEEKITDNIEAYEMYLKVKELRRKPNHYNNYQIRTNLINKIIDIDPGFAEAYALLCIEYSENVHFGTDNSQQKIDIAKENIEKALRLKPESAEVRFAYGYYYYGCFKDYIRALEHYNYALSKEPGNAAYTAYIGFVHRRLGNAKETIKYLEKAAILDPNKLLLQDELIGTYLFFRKYDKINLIESFKKTYRFAPNNGNLYGGGALFTFWMEENTSNARKIIKESSKLTPDYDYYKHVTWRLDIYDEKYEKYLDFVSNMEDTIMFDYQSIIPKYALIAFAYWLLDEKEKQEKAANKALNMMLKLEEYEGDPRYHSSLGIIYAQLDNKENAIRESKIALALSPPSKDAFKASVFEGYLAEVYTFLGEDEKALDIFEDLLSKPSIFSWEDIKYHWVYHKAFKDNPRFKSIVKKDEVRFRKEATYDLSIYLP